jgi:hypothetical protein
MSLLDMHSGSEMLGEGGKFNETGEAPFLTDEW